MQRHRSLHSRVAAMAMLLSCTSFIGCTADDELEPSATGFRVQLDRRHDTYEVSAAPSGASAPAELARGAIHVVGRDGNGDPRYAEDGTPIRHTCGAILIAPSYIVTAAHCVDSSDIPDPATTEVTLEMYPVTWYLDWMPATLLSTLGSWIDFSHPQMGWWDGYLTEQFGCELVMRCGSDWGPEHKCSKPDADVALLRCEGKPGNTYGFVEVADTDIDGANVFMPWAHEVYDIEGVPGDDLWYDHYTKYLSMETNLHYFGDGRNQLLPLRSIPRWVGDILVPNEKQFYENDLGVRWTDLVGCHGTSGSPVLQWNSTTQDYEYLGPISRGVFKHQSVGGGVTESVQLCQEPSLHGYGEASLAYSQLQYTKHVAQYANDCSGLLTKGPMLAVACLRAKIKTHWPELWFPWDEIEACPNCGVLAAHMPKKEQWFRFAGDSLGLPLGLEPGSQHRFSADVFAPEGVEGGIAVLTRSGELVASLEVSGDGDTPLQALAGALEADASGTLVIEATEGVSISRIALVPEGVPNGFDGMMDRIGVGLMVDDGESTSAAPMRFAGAGGEGGQGFVAVLQQGERMVMTREALIPDQAWTLGFSVEADALFHVGFILADGTEVVAESAVEDGAVKADFDGLDGTPIAVFVEMIEGPEQVAIDDVLIARL